MCVNYFLSRMLKATDSAHQALLGCQRASARHPKLFISPCTLTCIHFNVYLRVGFYVWANEPLFAQCLNFAQTFRLCSPTRVSITQRQQRQPCEFIPCYLILIYARIWCWGSASLLPFLPFVCFNVPDFKWHSGDAKRPSKNHATLRWFMRNNFSVNEADSGPVSGCPAYRQPRSCKSELPTWKIEEQGWQEIKRVKV